MNDDANENNDTGNHTKNNNKTTTSKYFNIRHAEFFVSLKCFISSWRSLDLPLINCKIELDLSWSRNCITYEVSRTLEIPANPKANPPTDHVPPSKTTGATFQIKNAKLYVSVLTLSIDESIKFSEHLKQGFRRTVSWNKYRSEITTQPKKTI